MDLRSLREAGRGRTVIYIIKWRRISSLIGNGLVALGRFFFDPCFFGHSDEWTRMRVNGVYYRACSRCTRPMKEILKPAEVVRTPDTEEEPSW
jgi:hypothetical protein